MSAAIQGGCFPPSGLPGIEAALALVSRHVTFGAAGRDPFWNINTPEDWRQASHYASASSLSYPSGGETNEHRAPRF